MQSAAQSLPGPVVHRLLRALAASSAKVTGVELPQQIHTLSRRQAWVISRAQAVAAGLSVSQLRTLVDSQRWQRPLRGVFVAHNGTITYLTQVWSALLYAGSGAVASHETAAYLTRMLDDAPADVRREAARRRKLRWRTLVGEMCDDAAAGVESPLERRYLREVEVAHGLPVGVRQSVSRHAGTMYRHDVYYDGYALVVELDGVAYHQGARAAADVRRDNVLIASGRLVLRYRWLDIVGSPCEVAREVAAALRLRGWTGTLRRCSRCRHLP